MKRRTFLIGGASSLTLVAVSACAPPDPDPTPMPTTTPWPLPVPEPARMVRSSWANDPYALGSFSYLGLGSKPDQRVNLAAPVVSRLFFAGEATSPTKPGTVAGARETGSRAADEVEAAAEPGERIAVIGAGIAGATSARQLHDAGFDVVVLEARERVGGRIDTRTSDDWDVPVELGAGRLDSGTAPMLLARLEALDISTTPFGSSVSVRTPDGEELAPSTIGSDTIAAAVAASQDRPGDVTLATALKQTYEQQQPSAPEPEDAAAITGTDWVKSYLHNDIAIAYGAEPEELSARYGTNDGDRDGDGDLIVTGGYESLVAETLDGVAVWTTSIVSAVSYGDDGVNIRFATGESLRVGRAVVTVPLGVLKSGAIRFEPSLPTAHIIATLGLGMGTVDKVWLRFDEPFWTTSAVRWTIVGGDLDITEWINLQPATGSPILVGLVGGERATALAELSDDEVIERARRSLEPFGSG
jgi:monoamine oxidase